MWNHHGPELIVGHWHAWDVDCSKPGAGAPRSLFEDLNQNEAHAAGGHLALVT
jgi:hypothetical protein